jgi:hypothetical protein
MQSYHTVNANTIALRRSTSSTAMLLFTDSLVLSKDQPTMQIAVQVPHVGFVTTDCHLPFLSITAIYHVESYERSYIYLWPTCVFIFIFMLNLNYSRGKR